MRPCTCDRDGCRLCWLYHNDERYRLLWSGEGLGEQESIEIGILKKAQLFASAVARYLATGAKQASPEEQAKRRALCDACEHRDLEKDRCRKCGCGLSGKLLSKISWESETCPDSRW
jgi:hypothetical protein